MLVTSDVGFVLCIDYCGRTSKSLSSSR